MYRYPVTRSPNIISIGYDEMLDILEIEFKLEVIHHYFNVPLDVFVALMKDDEPETYFFKYVYCRYHFDAM